MDILYAMGGGVMSQFDIQRITELVTASSQTTLIGAVVIVAVAMLIQTVSLALIARSVFKKAEREDATEVKSIDLAAAVQESATKFQETVTVILQAHEAKQTAIVGELGGLRASANAHTSAFQRVEQQAATSQAALTELRTAVNTLMEKVAAIPADVRSQVEALLAPQEQRILVEIKALAEKRKTDELPPVKIEDEVKLVTPPPDTLPEQAPISTTIPPEAATAVLTAPETEGTAT